MRRLIFLLLAALSATPAPAADNPPQAAGTYPGLSAPLAFSGQFVYGVAGTNLVRFKIE